MRTLMALVGAVLFFALAGCQQQNVLGGKDAPHPRPKRIVSLSPGATEIVALGVSNDVVAGRTEACDYPPGIEKTPVVGGVKPDYEKIAAIRPDIIVYDSGMYSEQDVAKLKQLGLDTFDVRATTIDEFLAMLGRLGARTLAETSFSDYADKIYRSRVRAVGAPYAKRPRVAVLLAGGGTSEHMIAGAKSFQADLVRAAGGEAIGPDADKFVVANAEWLVGQDPDVILTNGDPKEIMRDARLKATRAIRDGLVVKVSGDTLLRAGFRVNTVIDDLSNFFQTVPGAMGAPEEAK